MFIGNGIKTLLVEFRQDNGYIRFALVAVMPLLLSVSLVSFFFKIPLVYMDGKSYLRRFSLHQFFTLQIIQNVAMVIGPVVRLFLPPSSHPSRVLLCLSLF